MTHSIERPLSQLDVLAGILTHIEQEQVTSARLSGLRTQLTTGRLLPSAAIQRLHRLSERLDWERNMIFAPISALISWPLHVAAAIEAWRREFGTHVPEWLAIAGEYEALHSLAAYAYEHPADPFPIIKDDSKNEDSENADGPATFEGLQLGHPLVAANKMVTNDVRLTPDIRLLIGNDGSDKLLLTRLLPATRLNASHVHIPSSFAAYTFLPVVSLEAP